MKIPIRNILYLLTYAWDVLPIGELAWVSQLDAQNEVELFARVLSHGVNNLVKASGLDREYVEFSEDLVGLRGKIAFSETLKRNLLSSGKTHCTLDLLTPNVPQNQILKTTLADLLSKRRRQLGRSLSQELEHLLGYFTQVQSVSITPSLLNRVRIHRNNRHYALLLQVCTFIHEGKLLSEEHGEKQFNSFKDKRRFHAVFEKFVRNFYRRESNYKVRNDRFQWQETHGNAESLKFLPRMETDTVLRNSLEVIIVETKFYRKMFDERYAGTRKLRSAHLYQMFAYLRNLETRYGRKPRGIILYPAVTQTFHSQYELHGFLLDVATVNLDQDWPMIHEQLLSIAKSGTNTVGL